MTPAEEAVLAAARAYRDAHARCLAVGLDPPDGIDMDAAGDALLTAASLLVDAPPVEAPTVAPARPWPDPEAYTALAREVYGQSDLTAGARDVPSAVAAWKALQDDQRVMCARGLPVDGTPHWGPPALHHGQAGRPPGQSNVGKIVPFLVGMEVNFREAIQAAFARQNGKPDWTMTTARPGNGAGS